MAGSPPTVTQQVLSIPPRNGGTMGLRLYSTVSVRVLPWLSLTATVTTYVPNAW
jgi:hypothetical protein